MIFFCFTPIVGVSISTGQSKSTLELRTFSAGCNYWPSNTILKPSGVLALNALELCYVLGPRA